MSAREIDTVVPTAAGELNAVVRVPDRTGALARPLPGVVLVDGSGDGDRHSWGGWPEWIADAGSVTLRHDKPGCGGSPGSWHGQTLADRARESLAAAATLRAHPEFDARMPVGLYGVSQGGWVVLLAAALAADRGAGLPRVDFVVCHSGPGISPAAQERGRIEAELRAAGLAAADVEAGIAWVDERADRLRAGEDPVALFAAQRAFADRPWHDVVSVAYDSPERLGFVARILDFDPAAVLPDVDCPVLVLLGGADTVVPAHASLEAFARHLPPAPDAHAFAVFPGADHGLFVAARRPDVPRRDQLAPAYLPTLAAFLAARDSRTSDLPHVA